jgi:putative hydrolase of the HAD superfamily
LYLTRHGLAPSHSKASDNPRWHPLARPTSFRAMHSLLRPKAVLFDLFHTLVSLPKPGGEFGLAMADALGIPHAYDEIQRRYHEDDVLDRCRGRVRDPIEIMRAIAHGLDPSISDDAIATAVDGRRRRIEHGLVAIEPGILGALDRLRAAGIRTALVSDAGFDDVECWDRSPLRARLDAIAFSYELGVRKPDARIYQHALDALGVAPRDALFVGDGGSDEHRGARAVGMQTVLVTRLIALWRPELVTDRRPHADWEFEDVPAFVDALLG